MCERASAGLQILSGEDGETGLRNEQKDSGATVDRSLGFKCSVWSFSLSSLFILPPPLFLSPVSLSPSVRQPPLSPPFSLVSAHRWLISLSLSLFLLTLFFYPSLNTKARCGAVTNSIVRVQLLARSLAGNITGLKFGSSVLSPLFSLSPSQPCLVFSFFLWRLFFFIFLLRKTDRSGASFKVNGKAAFSPARFAVHACHSSASSLSPFPSPYPRLSFHTALSPLCIFRITVPQLCPFGKITQFSLHFPCLACMRRCSSCHSDLDQTVVEVTWGRGWKGGLWKHLRGDKSHYVCLFLLSALPVSNTEWCRDECGAPSLWLPVSELEHQRQTR